MTKAQAAELLGNRAKWELEAMYKALTSMRLLNTKEDEKRLEAVTVMLGVEL